MAGGPFHGGWGGPPEFSKIKRGPPTAVAGGTPASPPQPRRGGSGGGGLILLAGGAIATPALNPPYLIPRNYLK